LVGSSPLTTSTWSDTSATLTEKESVLQDPEEDEEEEDEDEGRARGGEGGSEEDTGRDKVDMTNLKTKPKTRIKQKGERTLSYQNKGERTLGYQNTQTKK